MTRIPRDSNFGDVEELRKRFEDFLLRNSRVVEFSSSGKIFLIDRAASLVDASLHRNRQS